MDVTIIGTGNMARGIGSRLLAGGHRLTVVGKDRERAEAVVNDLREEGLDGKIATAVSGDPLDGDVIVLAVYYPDARAAVEQHRDDLAGKIVVDITNPVNESFALVVPPDARFVKAFNTTFANTLTRGQVAGEPLDVFIAGDDSEAKDAVATLAHDGGLKAIDAGAGQRARELEAVGLLHMSVQETLGTGFGSALKVLAQR